MSDENSLVRKMYDQIHENINESSYPKTLVSQIKKLRCKLQHEPWIKQCDTDRIISKILIHKDETNILVNNG